jgi:hypothetical protein
VGRGVHFIACDILSYLDEISLHSCELVSKTWYSFISESKLWKKLHQKALLKTAPFQALILRKQFRMNASAFPNAKQLLFSYENLKANWRLKKFVGYGRNPRFIVSKCAMDSKRIIFAGSSIQVINRWTGKSECIIRLENISARSFQLYGDFIFFSSYCGRIDVWDCTTNQLIKRFQEPGKVWDMFLHTAHGLLISCFNVTPIDNNNEEDLDRRLDMRQQLDVSQCKVTIRRICTTPGFETIDERTELISHSDLHVVGLKSDANYFALILATSDHLKIQLRSTDTFQLVRYLDLHHCSPNALFDYHSGLFVTVSHQDENNEQIQLWDAKTLSCKASWLVEKWTIQVMLSSLHLIMRTSSSSKNTLSAWELSVQPPETKPKMLFEEEDKNQNILGFDELQIVTMAEYGFSIKVREFLMQNE